MTGSRGKLAAIGAVAVILGAMSAMAQTAEAPLKPSPEKGLAFAQRFCSNCHLVEGSNAASAQAGIPSLRTIANKPGQSGNHIRNVLISPHAPMPDMQVSNQEILDLVAYLETLRTDKSSPPLLSPASPDKPSYPKPS